MHSKDIEYASGRRLDSGFEKVKPKSKRRKLTKCRCGSITHLTTNSKKCPLNKANLKKVKESEVVVSNRAPNMEEQEIPNNCIKIIYYFIFSLFRRLKRIHINQPTDAHIRTKLYLQKAKKQIYLIVFSKYNK